MERAVQLVVHGKVQGVFFRDSTKHVADQLKIKGWICNQPDGTLLLEAEGDLMMLSEFIEWCKSGPESAEVAWVDLKDISVKGLRNFLILKKKMPEL